MAEIMNNYELLAPFQNINAGFSKWTYAKKNGEEYFLKEFLDPVYPTDESISLTNRKQRIDVCKEYEVEQKKLYEAVNRASHGNIVRIKEFFRYDNHYYVATRKVSGQKLTMADIQPLPVASRLLICKTIAFEMMNLHREHIVHADIKENNILIKQTKTGSLVGKIIDFDASFFESKPPMNEGELGGDQVYLAPEAVQFMCGEKVDLTCKMDVFALGLLFHQYLTGKMPEFDAKEYDYAFDAVLDDQTLKVDPSLTPQMQTMIQGMLARNPEKRLSMEEVFAMLVGKVKEDSIEVNEDQLDAEKVSGGYKSTVKANSSSDWFHEAGDL